MSCRTALFTCMMVISLVAGGSPAADKASPAPWQTDVERAWQTARTSRRPLILYFKMADCVYCRKMERETFSDQALASDIQTKFVAANLTLEQYPNLVKRYQVSTFPTTVIVAPDARVIDHIPGYIGPKDLQTRLRLAVETIRVSEEKTTTVRR